MKSILLIVIVFLGTYSWASSSIDKIIGENDLVAVDDNAGNIPLRYKNLVDAVGIISMGCTATHIGNGFVITAGHCFWASEEPVENQPCHGETVSWGVRGQKQAYLVSNCENIVIAQKSDTGDFAIFKVSPIPQAAIIPDLHRRAVIGDILTLFSHPDGLPLQWSNLCQVERAGQDSEVPELPPSVMRHQCDTNPGSSGAAILNEFSLKVVGIHNGGYVDEKDQGMNYGTYILDSPLGEKLRLLGF